MIETEVRQVRCIEFEGDTLAEVLGAAADWAIANDKNKVNVWSFATHFSPAHNYWYITITFIYWHDKDDPTLQGNNNEQPSES